MRGAVIGDQLLDLAAAITRADIAGHTVRGDGNWRGWPAMPAWNLGLAADRSGVAPAAVVHAAPAA